jgi:hypothetical protein
VDGAVLRYGVLVGPSLHRRLIIVVWACLSLTCLLLVVGHQGEHGLSWVDSQVSSYAAAAPLDGFVTAGMFTAAAGMLLTAVLLSWSGPFAGNLWAHLAALCFGASAVGLVVLASFEEAAPNLAALRRAGLEAVQQQSFHDAGLLVFFLSLVGGLVIAGIVTAAYRSDRVGRLLGVLVALSGPLAVGSLRCAWPSLLGIAGAAVGLRQRAAFLAFGVGVTLLVLVLKGSEQHRDTPGGIRSPDQGDAGFPT